MKSNFNKRKENRVILYSLGCSCKLWWIVVLIESDHQIGGWEWGLGALECLYFHVSCVLLNHSSLHPLPSLLFCASFYPFYFSYHHFFVFQRLFLIPFFNPRLFPLQSSLLMLLLLPVFSLCSKVELMNNGACNQFLVLPLHLSNTQTPQTHKHPFSVARRTLVGNNTFTLNLMN